MPTSRPIASLRHHEERLLDADEGPSNVVSTSVIAERSRAYIAVWGTCTYMYKFIQYLVHRLESPKIAYGSSS